jgi:cell division protein FtsQ
MARKSESAASAKASRSWLSILSYSARIAVAGVVLVAGLYGLNRAERFLVRDPRFSLIPPDFGLESSSLQLEGVRYASRNAILRVFAPDFGRSVYLLPLAQRRDKLRELDWVKDVSISRIWPNRAYVRIHEREPVAYVQLTASDRRARAGMIDANGVLLQQPAHARFELPVMTGIRSDEVLPQRRDKVRRLLLMMKDIGPLGERVSEVDVSDRSNIKVTARAMNRAVVLWLGDQNFAGRLQNFVNHYPDIQRKLPGATTLDLRLDDRITVVEDER